MSSYDQHKAPSVSPPPAAYTAPPPAGYPVKGAAVGPQQAPVETKSRDEDKGFWEGCCAALCCCCVLDMCC